ncbi:hypothetical protein Ddc_14487 [Ditylenchus destructor]|nr:hypothetical protein Ddc_14487 [Ditylenchus destructor]
MRYEYLGEYDVHKNTALGEIAVHFEKQIREKLKDELTATSPIKGQVKARLYAHSKKGGKTVLDRKETILDADHKLYEKVKDEDLLIIFAPMFQTSFNMILEPVDGEWSDSD